jgi:hypothetical protein
MVWQGTGHTSAAMAAPVCVIALVLELWVANNTGFVLHTLTRQLAHRAAVQEVCCCWWLTNASQIIFNSIT